MKKQFFWIPLYTVAAGAACGVLRQIIFSARDDRGLLSPSHWANPPLILLAMAAVAWLALYGFRAEKRDFRWQVPVPVQTVGCIAAAVGCLFWYLTDTDSSKLFTIAKLLAAVSLLVMAGVRFMRRKMPLWIPALFSFCMMLLCFSQYRNWGQNTQVWEYFFPALSALLIALYSLENCYMELPERNVKKAFILNQAAIFCTLACIEQENLPYSLGIVLWLIGGLFTTSYQMVLPKDVLYCIQKLEKAGFCAYAVGGCVRDAMLGLTPNDYDLCTNAVPEEICRVFQEHRLIHTGEKHGTVGVVLEQTVYEITTFRTEGGYTDNRHPDSVTFVSRVEDDLARRDFTVNAMAFHPKTGYVDPFGGQKDLQNGILRAVGQPELRFQEDALRILRGVRFACRFGLTLEKETLSCMNTLSPLIDNLAKERVYSELTQILCHIRQQDIMWYKTILCAVLPELKECDGFNQHTRHHAYDVLTHTSYVVEGVEADPALRWAALLHDVSKPAVFTQDESGNGHFYGHAQVSAETANAILHRLKAPNSLREQVVFLIMHHMDTISAEKVSLRKKLSKYGSENLQKLIKLQLADHTGKGTSVGGFPKICEKILQMVEQLEKEEGCLAIRDLAIDGHDLMDLGFEPGPALGDCQKQLLELVLNGQLLNDKEVLLEKAKEILKGRMKN